MTMLAAQVPISASNPCDYFGFFSKEEDRALEKYMARELPPIANPAASCTFNLFFGFFFDGTRNNYKLCQDNEGYSNVARLYDCYPGQVVPGVIGGDKAWPEYPHFYKVYVPGVGSPFEQANDEKLGSSGASKASGRYEQQARASGWPTRGKCDV